MDKKMIEKFKNENRPVWYMDTWSGIPIKAQIIDILYDKEVGEYVHLKCIRDAESYAVGTNDIMFEGLFPSKKALMEDAAAKEQDEIDTIKASIDTMADCIAFMFNHTVSCAEEYTDWTARRAIQEIAKERWGLNLE